MLRTNAAPNCRRRWQPLPRLLRRRTPAKLRRRSPFGVHARRRRIRSGNNFRVRQGSGTGLPLIHRSPRLAMDVTVAISAERDQIFVYVVTQQASRANVVNLETIGSGAVLASPT